jgi:predicted nucleic acid-binding Zn ribbon protein
MSAENKITPSSQWICGKCGSPLQIEAVNLIYLGSGYPVYLLVCTNCKRALVPADMALGKMLEVEKLLEDK